MNESEKQSYFFAATRINWKTNERLKNFIKLNDEYNRSRFIREAIREKLERTQ